MYNTCSQSDVSLYRSNRSILAIRTWVGSSLIAVLATLQVSSKGLFQVQLISVQNDNATTADGTPCLGDTSLECSTFARVCLTNLLRQDEQVDDSTTCEYGEQNTTVLGESRASFHYSFMSLDDIVEPSDSINIINLPFTFKWPVSLLS